MRERMADRPWQPRLSRARPIYPYNVVVIRSARSRLEGPVGTGMGRRRSNRGFDEPGAESGVECGMADVLVEVNE